MIRQLKQRGFYPLKDQNILLRLGEEVGEVYEAIREKQPKKMIAGEMADVFWMLLILADRKEIDLEKAFIEKHRYNQTRSLGK